MGRGAHNTDGGGSIPALAKDIGEVVAKHRSVCIDFDGVIHSYTSGWTGYDYIKDPPVEGAFAALESYLEHFTVYIFSTRSNLGGERGTEGMKKWFARHGFDLEKLDKLKFATKKPQATVYIDDRGFHFTGEFPAVEYIQNFKAWNKK